MTKEVSVVFPEHILPPYLGIGLEQVLDRVLCFIPLPHDRLQADHGLHILYRDQPPFTKHKVIQYSANSITIKYTKSSFTTKYRQLVVVFLLYLLSIYILFLIPYIRVYASDFKTNKYLYVYFWHKYQLGGLTNHDEKPNYLIIHSLIEPQNFSRKLSGIFSYELCSDT